MSAGFGAEKVKNGKAVVIVNDNEVKKLLKEYKKIKKYMKSPLYQVQVMDGTETKVSELLENYNEDKSV